MTFWSRLSHIVHSALPFSLLATDGFRFFSIFRPKKGVKKMLCKKKKKSVSIIHFAITNFSLVLPSFTKIPMDLTIRAGAMARLECAAVGHPVPQIAWQKDGGTDFPAARKRRMHVMPEDDVFFIVDVKIEDTGVYSCTAQNTAGSISANATLTVLGKTLTVLNGIIPLKNQTVAEHFWNHRPLKNSNVMKVLYRNKNILK